MSDASIANWAQLIQGEYREIPGLQLTKPQAERLWGLDATLCDALLTALVDARFLRRTRSGTYMRADSDH